MTNNIIIYFISLITINLLIIINLNKIAKAINLYDLPDNFRKIHQIPTPLIGGILFFLNIFFFILFFSFFNSSYIFYSFHMSLLYFPMYYESCNNHIPYHFLKVLQSLFCHNRCLIYQLHDFVLIQI